MMIMTTWQGVITIIMAMLGTMLTRFLPFLLFPESKEPPRFITYLGTVLPYAMTGLLVVYSLKGVRLTSGSHGIPELLAIIAIALLHIWKGTCCCRSPAAPPSICCWYSWFSLKTASACAWHCDYLASPISYLSVITRMADCCTFRANVASPAALAFNPSNTGCT